MTTEDKLRRMVMPLKSTRPVRTKGKRLGVTKAPWGFGWTLNGGGYQRTRGQRSVCENG